MLRGVSSAAAQATINAHDALMALPFQAVSVAATLVSTTTN